MVLSVREKAERDSVRYVLRRRKPLNRWRSIESV